MDRIDHLPDAGRQVVTCLPASRELVGQKRAGHAVVFGAQERPQSNVIDLMSALQASADRSSKRPSRAAARAASAKKSLRIRLAEHRERQGLDAMTRADLFERAARRKINVTAKMTKAQLIQALKDAKPATKKSGRRVS